MCLFFSRQEAFIYFSTRFPRKMPPVETDESHSRPLKKIFVSFFFGPPAKGGLVIYKKKQPKENEETLSSVAPSSYYFFKNLLLHLGALSRRENAAEKSATAWSATTAARAKTDEGEGEEEEEKSLGLLRLLLLLLEIIRRRCHVAVIGKKSASAPFIAERCLFCFATLSSRPRRRCPPVALFLSSSSPPSISLERAGGLCGGNAHLSQKRAWMRPQ